MQYILTQEEYDNLVYKAFQADSLTKELKHFKDKYHDTKTKYQRLLVFGVSTNNEKLKLQ